MFTLMKYLVSFCTMSSQLMNLIIVLSKFYTNYLIIQLNHYLKGTKYKMFSLMLCSSLGSMAPAHYYLLQAKGRGLKHSPVLWVKPCTQHPSLLSSSERCFFVMGTGSSGSWLRGLLFMSVTCRCNSWGLECLLPSSVWELWPLLLPKVSNMKPMQPRMAVMWSNIKS